MLGGLDAQGGGYYGYKIDMATCSTTGLPVACKFGGRGPTSPRSPRTLLDAACAHGFTPETCALDKGYDLGSIYAACEDRDVRPIIPLRETPDVKRGDHRPPECEHGTWTFAAADPVRGASKWRCPIGECKPTSKWVKVDRLHPLVPRESKRWKL